MIIALAGRRIDAPGANPARFPLENVEMVRLRIRALFPANSVTALVSSAACGADLIALSEAGNLGLRRRVILPFAKARFRETSVVDRPGDWGPLFDRIIGEADAAADLVILETGLGPGLETGTGDEAYAAVNSAILDEAMKLARATQQNASAVMVWDGISRGSGDLTEAFGVEARKRGLPVSEILTF